MTRKDIIRMAGEVDAVTKILLDRKAPQGMDHDVFVRFLERFAELVRADEREACAKVCDEVLSTMFPARVSDCAAIIRARGQDLMPLFSDWPGGWRK